MTSTRCCTASVYCCCCCCFWSSWSAARPARPSGGLYNVLRGNREAVISLGIRKLSFCSVLFPPHLCARCCCSCDAGCQRETRREWIGPFVRITSTTVAQLESTPNRGASVWESRLMIEQIYGTIGECTNYKQHEVIAKDSQTNSNTFN